MNTSTVTLVYTYTRLNGVVRTKHLNDQLQCSYESIDGLPCTRLAAETPVHPRYAHKDGSYTTAPHTCLKHANSFPGETDEYED